MTVADLRLGAWQDVLADVEVDALIFDAPFSARVHDGHNAGVRGRTDQAAARSLDYKAITAEDVAEFVASWSPRVRGWICSLTSHDLVPAWETAMQAAGRYTFPPLPVIGPYIPRILGDGPGSGVVQLVVGRPRSAKFLARGVGSLPSHYIAPPGQKRRLGGKPLGLMAALIRDYSWPGDQVADPFAGCGTTLRAALEEGRRAIGSEVDLEAFRVAEQWLAEPVTTRLFPERNTCGRQSSLF